MGYLKLDFPERGDALWLDVGPRGIAVREDASGRPGAVRRRAGRPGWDKEDYSSLALGDLRRPAARSVSVLSLIDDGARHVEVELLHGRTRAWTYNELGQKPLVPAPSPERAPTIPVGGPLSAGLLWADSERAGRITLCAVVGFRGEGTFLTLDCSFLPERTNPTAEVRFGGKVRKATLDHRC